MSKAPFKGTSSELGNADWSQKTGMLGLPGSEMISTKCLAVSTLYRVVTNTQTNGQTDRRLSTANTALRIASRGKNDVT